MAPKNSSKELSIHLNFRLIIILFILISASLLSELIINGKINIFLDKKIAEAKENQRPASLDIVILNDSSCKECYGVQSLIDRIKKENVKIGSEKTIEINSSDGLELINKFNIDKAPTIVVTGELNKITALQDLWKALGDIKDNTFVLRSVGAPYVMTNSGDIRGKIKLTMLVDKTCDKCYDVTQHEKILKGLGIFLENSQVLDAGLKDGKKSIGDYKIELLPTIILTGDLDAYANLKSVWSPVGTIEKDGTYIFREGVKQMGIYKDLTSGKVITPPPANQPTK